MNCFYMNTDVPHYLVTINDDLLVHSLAETNKNLLNRRNMSLSSIIDIVNVSTRVKFEATKN